MQATICDLCRAAVIGEKDKMYQATFHVVAVKDDKKTTMVNFAGDIGPCCIQNMVTALAGVGIKVKVRGGGRKAKKEAGAVAPSGKPRGRPKGSKNKGETKKKAGPKKKTTRRKPKNSEPPKNSKTNTKSEPAHRMPMAQGFGSIAGS